MAGRTEVLRALAAITGQTLSDVEAALHEGEIVCTDQRRAGDDDVRNFFARLKTRLGLAPAVDSAQATDLRKALDSVLSTEVSSLTRGDLDAYDRLLRHTPEHIPTLNREPVKLPPLPRHQTEMWKTLLGLEDLRQPWVLVGGQMTMLHCLENALAPTRPTDDGDIVVGVWTRRDALRKTSRFLRDRSFEEQKTGDGYGYRFKRDRTVIDILLPEGLERQREFPATNSGRRGLITDGGNQALTRAERVPVTAADITGYVRRPNLLGSIVAKAHAYVIDSRDKARHAEDLVTLSEIALRDPGATLRHSRPGDRKPVRRFLNGKTVEHVLFRAANDPEAVFAFLTRLSEG